MLTMSSNQSLEGTQMLWGFRLADDLIDWQDGAQYKTGPQEQNILAAGTLSFRNTREAKPREEKHVNRWTARPEGQAE